MSKRPVFEIAIFTKGASRCRLYTYNSLRNKK
nr:MAG TPA: hypothetical protein [Caudoviricetes sp.]